MFLDAYNKASKFTHPLVISTRNYSGKVFSGLGSFIILNKEGWILTAAHVLNDYFEYLKHKPEIEEFEKKLAELNDNPKIHPNEARRMRKRMKANNEWITHYGLFWGIDGKYIDKFFILKEADIVVAKLNNFNDEIALYPKFIDPKKVDSGRSLCKLGFPFHQVKSSFILESGQFEIARDVFPVPRFPIEGITTRIIHKGKSSDGIHDIKFIETSSPGLRGQSGGPIFDVEGNIWAMQSQTVSLPLGFQPKLIFSDGKHVEEHQFINLGLGTHVETILSFLDRHKVSYEVAS